MRSLIARGGLYARLAELQFDDDDRRAQPGVEATPAARCGNLPLHDFIFVRNKAGTASRISRL